ncbi:hypothetical protein HDU93_006017 [Gonapodya sp. JEL0774]|nr:hypothetical protein HDU93_006017 [Gonapodya sp. JEL0774]
MYGSTSAKPVYVGLRTEPTALTKIVATPTILGYPLSSPTALALLPIPSTISLKSTRVLSPPVAFVHPLPVSMFQFSPSFGVVLAKSEDRSPNSTEVQTLLIASTSRNDLIIRIWSISPAVLDRLTVFSSSVSSEFSSSDEPPALHMDVAHAYLAGHEGKVSCFQWHPCVYGLLASGASDSTIRIWDVHRMLQLRCINLSNPLPPVHPPVFSSDPSSSIVQPPPTDPTTQSPLTPYHIAWPMSTLIAVATQDGAVMLLHASGEGGVKVLLPAPSPPTRPASLIALLGTPYLLLSLPPPSRRFLLLSTTCFSHPDTSTTSLISSIPLPDGPSAAIPVWDERRGVAWTWSKGEAGVGGWEVEEGYEESSSDECGNVEWKKIGWAKVDKGATALAHIEPPGGYDRVKWEVGRFVRILPDSSIDLISLHIPRREALVSRAATVSAQSTVASKSTPMTVPVDDPVAAMLYPSIAIEFDGRGTVVDDWVRMLEAEVVLDGTGGLLESAGSAAHSRVPSVLSGSIVNILGAATGGKASTDSPRGSPTPSPGLSRRPTAAAALRRANTAAVRAPAQSSRPLYPPPPFMAECELRRHSGGGQGGTGQVAIAGGSVGFARAEGPWVSGRVCVRKGRVWFLSRSTVSTIGPRSDRVYNLAGSVWLDEIVRVDTVPYVPGAASGVGGFGATVEDGTIVWRMRFGDERMRDVFVSLVNERTKELGSSGKLTRTTAGGSQDLVRRATVLRQTSLLMSAVEHLGPVTHAGQARPAPPETWRPRLATLDADGILLMHEGDLRTFRPGSEPVEAVDVGEVMSARLADMTAGGVMDVKGGGGGMDVVQVTMADGRAEFFKCRSARDAAEWVVAFRDVIDNVGSVGCEAGECQEIEVEVLCESDKQGKGELMQGAKWLAMIEGDMFYYEACVARIPERVVKAAEIIFVEVCESPNETATRTANVPRPGLPPLPGRFRSTAWFRTRLADGSAIVHGVSSTRARDRFCAEMARQRLRSYDMLGRLGVKSEVDLGLLGARAGRSIVTMASTSLVGRKQPHVFEVDGTMAARKEAPLMIVISGAVKLVTDPVPLHYSHLHPSICAVLDAGDIIYRWAGPDSSRVCRGQAMDWASRIRKERQNRPRICVVDERDSGWPQFWKVLGSEKGEGVVAGNGDGDCLGGDDSLANRTPRPRIIKVLEVQFCRVFRKRLELVYEGIAPSKNLLKSGSCYLVVGGDREVLLWVGKGSPMDLRELASNIWKAVSLRMSEVEVSMKGEGNERCPGYVVIMKTNEGQESVLFKDKFVDYVGSLPISMRPAEEGPARIARSLAQTDIDVSIFNAAQNKPKEAVVDDDGKEPGNLSVYLVNEFSRVDVPPSRHNVLFESDSYLMIYRYRPAVGGTSQIDKRVAYFWQGRDSPITQKGTAALLAVELGKEGAGEVQQVRVMQGKEPSHFVKILGGLVVFKIGRDPLVERGARDRNEARGSLTVFDVRESEQGNLTAWECEVRDISLYPFASLVLIPPQELAIIYHGPHVNESARRSLESQATRDCQFLFGTHKTPSGKFKLVAGTAEIHDLLRRHKWEANEWQRAVENLSTSISNRFFGFSIGVGNVMCDELFLVTQDDLAEVPVLMCDNGEEVFVRLCNAKPQEKTVGLRTILKFVETAKRSPSVWVIDSGREPPPFTCRFQGWRRQTGDSTLHTFERRPAKEALEDLTRTTFTLSEVLQFSSTLQTGGGAQAISERHHIDVSKLEELLSDSDFETLFKMTRESFIKIPEWKKQRVKQEVGIY